MRPIAALLVLAVLAAPAPAARAATPKGEVVFVGTGPSSGTVTVPSTVTLDFQRMTVRTTSPYLLLAVVRGRDVVAGVDLAPGLDHEDPLVTPSRLFTGTSTVRMLTRGTTTITVPATGIRGRLVVRLARPVRGSTAKIVPVPIVGETVRDDIVFHVAGPALTMHGYSTSAGAADAGGVDVFCVARQGNDPTCVSEGGVSGPLYTTRARAEWYYPEDELAGDLHAQVAGAQATYGPAFTHYLLSLPIG